MASRDRVEVVVVLAVGVALAAVRLQQPQVLPPPAAPLAPPAPPGDSGGERELDLEGYSPQESAPGGPPSGGWLRVGGPEFGANGAEVELDGRVIGYAPLEAEPGVGTHQLVIRATRHGRVLLRRTVHIGAHHTRLEPLRVLR